MTAEAQRLIDLLPAIYRIRDIEQARILDILPPLEASELQGLEANPALTAVQQTRLLELRSKADTGPLAAVLSVIEEQIEALQENLDQLYDDQFIETCAEWVAAYIGDLIGYRPLHGVIPSLVSPRAEVANTISFRRRKGTPAMLEQLAANVTGWPARVVEYFQLLGWTQYMNHVRPSAAYAPSLRRPSPPDPAFDSALRTVEVRRVDRGGLYNIPNVGLHLWRIGAYSLTRSPAVADALDPSGRLLRFNPLGTDMQLYTHPQTEDDIGHLAEPINLPLPIELRWLSAHLGQYYGRERSFYIEVAGAGPNDPPVAPDVADFSVCNLSDIVDGGGNVTGWAHVPLKAGQKIAVDPVLGRIAFAEAPAGAVLVSFHYGAVASIGGGEYERADPPEHFDQVQSAIGGGALQPQINLLVDGGLLEIEDSCSYQAPSTIQVNDGKTLVIRAKNGFRPLLTATTPITLDLKPGATLVLDGIVLTGAGLTLPDAADDQRRTLKLRHTTLVPGLKGASGGTDGPSIVIRHAFTTVAIESSILGPIHTVEDADIKATDSIIDATADDLEAFRDPDVFLKPGGNLTLTNVTVVGRVHARVIEEATQVLFVAKLPGGDGWKAPVWADRRQVGCVRFSYVPAGSRTPRRFHCQPPEHGDQSLRPSFTSLRYGNPAYCQLSNATPAAIRTGAEDESEIGVYHLLFQPQREINLRLRLEEYLRFGLEAAIIYAS